MDGEQKFFGWIITVIAVCVVVIVLGVNYFTCNRDLAAFAAGYEKQTLQGSGQSEWAKAKK